MELPKKGISILWEIIITESYYEYDFSSTTYFWGTKAECKKYVSLLEKDSKERMNDSEQTTSTYGPADDVVIATKDGRMSFNLAAAVAMQIVRNHLEEKS